MTEFSDPLERRMSTDLPCQLDQAVEPFDAQAIARVATTRDRPSVLRMTAVTAVVAIAAVTAVVAIQGLSGGMRGPGSLAPSGTPSPTSTPEAPPAAVGPDQLASIQRADEIINTNLTPEEIALVVNAQERAVEDCMQERGWDFENGTYTPETAGDGFSAMSTLDQWTFADVASAGSVGFGLESHLTGVSAFIETLDTGGAGRRPDEDNMSPEVAERYWLDLGGTDEERVEIVERDGSHAGAAGGGCMGGGTRAVWGDIAQEMRLRDARDTAQTDIWVATVADQAVGNALDRWRGCVFRQGLVFGDPHDAFESALAAALSGDHEQERVIATTDAQCKAESSLDLAVQAAFLSATNELLSDFEEDLMAFQQLERESLARAKDILGFEE